MEQPEPALRYSLYGKKARRYSRSREKKSRNKSLRMAFKNNFYLGKEALKKQYGYEF